MHKPRLQNVNPMWPLALLEAYHVLDFDILTWRLIYGSINFNLSLDVKLQTTNVIQDFVEIHN